MLIIIQNIIISLIIIFFFHSLWNYIQENYAIKKTKDLVGFQTEKYKKILNEYIENSSQLLENSSSDFLNDSEKETIHNDLDNILLQHMDI